MEEENIDSMIQTFLKNTLAVSGGIMASKKREFIKDKMIKMPM